VHLAGDATIDSLLGDLALQITRAIMRSGTTQSAAAKRLAIRQPTVSKIVNGLVSGVSIELLIRVAVRIGLPIALQTGRTAAEAGVYLSATLQSDRRSPRSQVGGAARAA